MEILSPRSERRSRVENFNTLRPLKAMVALSETVARLVSRPMTVRAVTDLPEPNSPTMATVSPRCSWKETPFHRLHNAVLNLEGYGHVACVDDRLVSFLLAVMPLGCDLGMFVGHDRAPQYG